jgi:hypothetical protein
MTTSSTGLVGGPALNGSECRPTPWYSRPVSPFTSTATSFGPARTWYFGSNCCSTSALSSVTWPSAASLPLMVMVKVALPCCLGPPATSACFVQLPDGEQPGASEQLARRLDNEPGRGLVVFFGNGERFDGDLLSYQVRKHGPAVPARDRPATPRELAACSAAHKPGLSPAAPGGRRSSPLPWQASSACRYISSIRSLSRRARGRSWWRRGNTDG